MIRIFKVEGDSMYPFLKKGHRVFCYRFFFFLPLHVDQIVVFEKDDMLLIKRVSEIKPQGVYVKGTDAYSQDSSTFGLIKKEQIRYKVLFRF